MFLGFLDAFSAACVHAGQMDGLMMGSLSTAFHHISGSDGHVGKKVMGAKPLEGFQHQILYHPGCVVIV